MKEKDKSPQKKMEIINESSEESFPASDAPSWAAHTQMRTQNHENEHAEPIENFSLKTHKTLKVNDKEYHYYSLPDAEKAGLKGLSKLPFTLKILLENLIRYEDGHTVTFDDIKAVIDWLERKSSDREIAYRPTRVLMQDFTGVPAVVDLAAMRAAIKKLGGNPEKINPLSPVDLVIDHSIQVDAFLTKDAIVTNAAMEMERNYERYEFFALGSAGFSKFSSGAA